MREAERAETKGIIVYGRGKENAMPQERKIKVENVTFDGDDAEAQALAEAVADAIEQHTGTRPQVRLERDGIIIYG